MAGWRWRRLRAAWRLETDLMEESRRVKKDRIAAMSHQILGDMQLEISIQGGVHRN